MQAHRYCFASLFKVIVLLCCSDAFCNNKETLVILKIDNKHNVQEISGPILSDTANYDAGKKTLDNGFIFSDPYITTHQRIEKFTRYTQRYSREIIFKTTDNIETLSVTDSTGTPRLWLDIIQEKSKDLVILIEIRNLGEGIYNMYIFQEGRLITAPSRISS